MRERLTYILMMGVKLSIVRALCATYLPDSAACAFSRHFRASEYRCENPESAWGPRKSGRRTLNGTVAHDSLDAGP